jgi:hypothetical protein
VFFEKLRSLDPVGRQVQAHQTQNKKIKINNK